MLTSYSENIAQGLSYGFVSVIVKDVTHDLFFDNTTPYSEIIAKGLSYVFVTVIAKDVTPDQSINNTTSR